MLCRWLLALLLFGDVVCGRECYSIALERAVVASECEHGCCWDDFCGSRDECSAATVVLLVVLFLVLFCTAIAVGVLVWCSWTRRACFARPTPLRSLTTLPQIIPCVLHCQQPLFCTQGVPQGDVYPAPVYGQVVQEASMASMVSAARNEEGGISQEEEEEEEGAVIPSVMFPTMAPPQPPSQCYQPQSLQT